MEEIQSSKKPGDNKWYLKAKKLNLFVELKKGGVKKKNNSYVVFQK